MNYKACIVMMMTALAAPMAMADDDVTTATRDAATTATRPADTNTTAMDVRARNFSEENFNKRWATEESVYSEAGVSEENIAKLREINYTQWKAIGAGQRGNVQEVTRAMRELLTPEQFQEVREIRKRNINSHLSRGRGTTVTATTAE